MWPRLSPHILRHSEVRSPVLYPLEHFLGDSNNRIWFSDNQGWSLSRARAGVSMSHVSFPFPHRHSGPREGTEFKFKSPLWPSHQLTTAPDLIWISMQWCFALFFPAWSPLIRWWGPCDQARPRGSWWPSSAPPVVTIVSPHCWWPLSPSPGSRARHNNVHNTHRESQNVFQL